MKVFTDDTRDLILNGKNAGVRLSAECSQKSSFFADSIRNSCLSVFSVSRFLRLAAITVELTEPIEEPEITSNQILCLAKVL